MRSLVLFLSINALLFSCNYDPDPRFVTEEEPFLEENSELTTEEEIELEQVPQQLPIELAVESLQFDTLSLPLYFGEGAIDTLEKNGEFTLEQLIFVSQNFEEDSKNSDYYLQESKRIYDLKKKGKYDEYVEGLDLANLKDATAHAYGLVNLDSALILLWSVNYSSYEACPYYTGTELMATLIKDGKVIKSRILGTENYGGDPPASGETSCILSISKDLLVDYKSYDKTFEDEDLMESDSTSSTYSIFE